MPESRRIPENPLAFIKLCIEQRKIFWTYHVNMRLGQRPISRELILGAVDSFDVIEEYPDDKYLPSYLLRAQQEELVFHVHIDTDISLDNVRIVTAYIPDSSIWEKDFKTRRKET
jgi:hypothetical protein